MCIFVVFWQSCALNMLNSAKGLERKYNDSI